MKSTNSHTIRIYMAGDLAIAKSCILNYCTSRRVCFNVNPTTYIYHSGDSQSSWEDGFVVELINYAKRPLHPSYLMSLCKELAVELKGACNQQSYSIVSDNTSEWYHD